MRRRLGHRQLHRRGFGLHVVEGVGDRALRRLLDDEVERGLREAELRAGQHDGRNRDERRAVEDLVSVLGAVAAATRPGPR